MNIMLFFLLVYLIAIAFLIYVFICGNNKYHREGFIGSVYRFVTIKVPDACSSCMNMLLPERCQCKGEESCFGVGGPCRFFIAGFYICIYAGFVIIYMIYVYPYINSLFSHPDFARFFSFFVLPWPWVIFIAFQYMDPGLITRTNVKSYLEIYPHDNVLYRPKICSTDHIPVVPRSRYCKYTHRRVAKYDHYCPWVLASIGERTHRFFLLFLLSDIIASSFYAYGCIAKLVYIISYYSTKIRWTNSLMKNILFGFLILMRSDPFVVADTLLLVVVALSLIFFFCQQCYFISINVTQIELDKYDYVKEMRKRAGNNTPVANFYNKGFVENWKHFLFPEKPKEHEPIDLIMEDEKNENKTPGAPRNRRRK